MCRKERAVSLRRQQRALTAVTAATAVTWLMQALQVLMGAVETDTSCAASIQVVVLVYAFK
jgi:hypothetical protein